MHALPNKRMRLAHLPGRHGFVPWVEHLVQDEHFWLVVAWIILVLTFAFFATSPVY